MNQEEKPIFIELEYVLPCPDEGNIKFLLKSQTGKQFQFALTAEVACQFLAALLQKKVLPGRLSTFSHYPTPLESIARIEESTGQNLLQLFFPSGLPVTIEFPRGIDEVDALINVLQDIKDEMINNPKTEH